MLKCCGTSKLLHSQNYCKHYNYYEMREISKLSWKQKYIYIKLNILNSNTSGMTKLQFIELYISYFLLECNIPSDANHLLSIIILNSLSPIILLLNPFRVLLGFIINNN